MITMSQNTAYDLHLQLGTAMTPSMAFRPELDFETQKAAIRNKLLEVLAIPEKLTDPIAIVTSSRTDDPRFDEYCFEFESEPNFFIPGHLLLPKGTKKPLPVIICLQGHAPGMFVSLSRDSEGNPKPSKGDRDFAIQAVTRGYAAVVMEQRGFGRLSPKDHPEHGKCEFQAMQALLIGRTMLGQRCYDISRLIDALRAFDLLDLNHIGIMGNSGGGMASFYGAAVEPRISASMPSCSFCSYKEAHLPHYHCACAFLPGILKYMDMPDMAILIAPRPLVIVAGKTDSITNISGVKSGFETVKRIYEKAGAPDKCHLVIGEEGHRFYADQAWPIFAPEFPLNP